MITQARLKELLHYNPDSGLFTWIKSQRRRGLVAGHVPTHGYRRIIIDRKLYYAHRLAFLYMSGSFPPEEVDHTNGKRDDNRWRNLVAVTPTENRRNLGMRYDNSSGITGVSIVQGSGKWQAHIGGKYIGKFETLLDAASARKSAEISNRYHKNHGRPA